LEAKLDHGALMLANRSVPQKSQKSHVFFRSALSEDTYLLDKLLGVGGIRQHGEVGWHPT
jgi:hypothetical protein